MNLHLEIKTKAAVIIFYSTHLSHPMTKSNKMETDCAEAQADLRFPWRQGNLKSAWASAQSALSACRKLGSLATQWTHIEDSDKLGGCSGWSVFTGRTCHFVGLVKMWLIYACRPIKLILASSADPDQTPQKRSVWSGSVLFTLSTQISVINDNTKKKTDTP